MHFMIQNVSCFLRMVRLNKLKNQKFNYAYINFKVRHPVVFLYN